MSKNMKKCPYCAEQILNEAVKCKHCGSSLRQHNSRQNKQPFSAGSNNKKAVKLIGKILLVIFAIFAWYISIPAMLLWYIWRKSKWDKKKKHVGTALAVVLFGLLVGLASHINRAPTLIVVEPKSDGFTVQLSEVKIKGIIDPKDSTLNINGRWIKTEDGKFSYPAKLVDEKNTFILKVSNGSGELQRQIVINRTFTEEELAGREREQAEKEAKRQIAVEAQNKAEEEERVKELAEQKAWEQSKAGQICKAHPEWLKPECEKLADNKIWIGMDYDMIVYERGRPNSANPSDYGFGTEWQWCWHNYTPSCFYDDNDDGIIDSYN